MYVAMHATCTVTLTDEDEMIWLLCETIPLVVSPCPLASHTHIYRQIAVVWSSTAYLVLGSARFQFSAQRATAPH
jgi:hypothetical protein